MRSLCALVTFALFCGTSTFCQTNESNRQNRTIEVVVTETARVEPDIALVTLGCLAYGETHDQAYQANLRIADKVIKALFDAGLSKEQIESNAIELNETNADDVRNRVDQKGRQFTAHQSWHIRLKASDAQKIIDIAVQAGANGIEDVNWEVSDPEALEGKARAAAMKKARATAAELAESAGDKLGELLYASNTVNGIMEQRGYDKSLQTESVMVSADRSATPAFSLKLFPAKVEKEGDRSGDIRAGLRELLFFFVLWRGVFGIGFDGNFNFGALFQLHFTALFVDESVFNSNFTVQVIRALNGDLRFFRGVREHRLDDLLHDAGLSRAGLFGHTYL